MRRVPAAGVPAPSVSGRPARPTVLAPIAGLLLLCSAAPALAAAPAADGPGAVGTSLGSPGRSEIRPSVGITQNVPGRLLNELGTQLKG
ncbi:hypothetical protein [Streptomyces sp. NPDC097619]|uniref:hypothetical protein n=1 Tax=Streptomyces sp. NPDC097619 TaxID=3157228 RepID=UPI003318A763